MTTYPDLLVWWSATITAGILFLVAVSVVLYQLSKWKNEKPESFIAKILMVIKDFAFVWVLLTLLSLYIVSISGGQYTMFALGNVVIEALIFVYLVLTRKPSAPS